MENIICHNLDRGLGNPMSVRSVSAVDTAAAQRARARAAYSQITRHRPALGTASLRKSLSYTHILVC